MRRSMLGLLAGSLAFGVLAGAASAEPPSAVGWWTSTPGAAAANEGGFEVAGLAGNPVSVAALRFATAPAGGSANLVLTESGGTVTPTTSLQVCPTTQPWEPANPGPLDDAPEPDCTAGIPLTRDEAAATWSAPVGALLGSGTIMIVPGDTPGGGSPLDLGFRVQFSGADLQVTTASTSPSFTPSPMPSPSNPGGGGGGGFSGGGSPSFTAPSAPAPATPTTVAGGAGDTTSPTTVAVDESSSGSSQEAFGAPDLAAGATVGGGGSDQPWERLLFLVPLSALAGVLWVYAKRALTARGMVETG